MGASTCARCRDRLAVGTADLIRVGERVGVGERVERGLARVRRGFGHELEGTSRGFDRDVTVSRQLECCGAVVPNLTELGDDLANVELALPGYEVIVVWSAHALEMNVDDAVGVAPHSLGRTVVLGEVGVADVECQLKRVMRDSVSQPVELRHSLDVHSRFGLEADHDITSNRVFA